jgi:hypothetical protein
MLSQMRATARDARAVSIPSSHTGVSARTVVALARIEVRRILLHPSFVGGMGGCVLFLLTVVGGGADIKFAWLAVGFAVGVAAGGFLSTNLAAQRARRDGLLELYGSLPSPPEARTAGVLLGALLGPVALMVPLTAIGTALLQADTSTAPYADLALAVQPPLTVAALCALAVGLARWLPGPFTAPVVLLAQIMSPLVWAVPWIAPTSTGIRVGWHMAYLVSVIVLWCLIALLRDRVTPARSAIAALAFLVASLGVAFQIPPGGLQ